MSKKKRKKSWIIIIVVVVLLLVVVGSIIGGVSKSMQAAMEQMGEQGDMIYEAARQDIRQEITTSGITIGMEKDAYTSPVTAKVEDIYVEVGQIVRKGDVLLTYDASNLGDDLAKVKIQAQSERAAGSANYEMADEAAGKVTAAQKEIKKLEKEIKQLKKEIENINDSIVDNQDLLEEAEQKNAKEESAAATPTEEGTTRAPKLIDTKPYIQTIRSLNKDLAKKQEALAEKQADLAEQQGIVSANKDVKVSDSTKAQMQAAEQLSNMNINDAQESLDAAEAGIVAAEDGIVESIEIVKGAYANETQTLLTIIHSDSAGVEFSISKDDLDSISKGQKARVVIAGNEYQGTVDYISRVAVNDTLLGNVSAGGGTIKGRIRLSNPDDSIYIGVTAKVYIFVGESNETLAVPYEALNTDIDGDFVLVVNRENIIERRDVTLGLYSDNYYEITNGLEEGDRVIRNVTSDMKPGDEYVANVGNAMPGMMAE